MDPVFFSSLAIALIYVVFYKYIETVRVRPTTLRKQNKKNQLFPGIFKPCKKWCFYECIDSAYSKGIFPCSMEA